MKRNSFITKFLLKYKRNISIQLHNLTFLLCCKNKGNRNLSLKAQKLHKQNKIESNQSEKDPKKIDLPCRIY